MKKNQSRKKLKIFKWLAALLLVLVLGYFGIGAYIAYSATLIKIDSTCTPETPATFDLEYSNVKFKARGDDLMIAGWFIPREGSDKVIILVHGRNANKQIAITCNFPKLAAELHDAGFAVLIIDTRGHGDSEGNRYSFGFYERRDVLGAVDFLLEKGFSPGKIGALGISNGSGAVIGAASEDDAIGAIALDSAIADMGEIIERMFEQETGLPNFFLYGADVMARVIFGFSFMDVKPVLEIVHIPPRPILIMQCAVDETVGFDQAELLKQAVPGAELIVFDDCSHAELYRDYPQEYLNAVVSLFKDEM